MFLWIPIHWQCIVVVPGVTYKSNPFIPTWGNMFRPPYLRHPVLIQVLPTEECSITELFHVGADWVLLWPLLPSRTWTTSWYGVVSGAMIVYILSSQNTWSTRTTERTCHKLPAKEKDVNLLHFNPLTPMSDQDRISPYNINTISIR